MPLNSPLRPLSLPASQPADTLRTLGARELDALRRETPLHIGATVYRVGFHEDADGPRFNVRVVFAGGRAGTRDAQPPIDVAQLAALLTQRHLDLARPVLEVSNLPRLRHLCEAVRAGSQVARPEREALLALAREGGRLRCGRADFAIAVEGSRRTLRVRRTELGRDPVARSCQVMADWLTEDLQGQVSRALESVAQACSTPRVQGESRPEARMTRADVMLAIARACGGRANLSGADLSGLDLSNLSLEGAQLVHANLAHAILDDCVLSGANLAGANLVGCEALRADFTGADLRAASLSGATLSHAVLDDANLIEADLGNAVLDGAAFRRTSLRHARMAGASLDGIDVGRGECLADMGIELAHVRRLRLQLDDLAAGALRNWRLDHRANGAGLALRIDAIPDDGVKVEIMRQLVDRLDTLRAEGNDNVVDADRPIMAVLLRSPVYCSRDPAIRAFAERCCLEEISQWRTTVPDATLTNAKLSLLLHVALDEANAASPFAQANRTGLLRLVRAACRSSSRELKELAIALDEACRLGKLSNACKSGPGPAC